MYHSLWFLAATLAAGQTGDAVPCASCAAAAAQQQVLTSPAPTAPARRPGLFERISNRLHGRGPDGAAPAAAATASQPLVPQPVSASPLRPVAYVGGDGGVVTAGLKEVPTTGDAAAVSPQLRSQFGHADDYGWITGQLCYVHTDGGVWVLRYASVDWEDRFGGSVVLTTPVSMKNFRDGDLVTVNGGFLDENRTNKHLGGPLYRATTVDLIERADP